MPEELTEYQMLKALYDKFILGGEEPEPPPPPEPPGPDSSRPKAMVVVTADKCHLRFVDHLDGAGKAVWGSFPKGSDNPKRDRYLIYLGVHVEVYMDGEIEYGIYKGAIKGSGGNHGWEVCPGQTFNGHLVTGNPKLYILCKDSSRL
jgi:hypothetical protein